MHLVFATSLVPAGRPSTGYEIANAAVLDSLRRLGVRVTVLGFVWPGRVADHPDTTIVLGEQDVRNETASRWQKGEWLATALAGGLTFASAKMRTVSARDVRAAIDRLGQVDGYILNSVQFAGAFPDLFRDRPSIYIAHNVEHRSASENAAAARSAVERLLFQREARLLARVESRLCADAAFVFTLADEDRAELGVAGDSRSLALPLVTRAHVEAPRPRTIAVDAGLIGTWTWQPNRIGLEWFLGEVVPRLPAGFTVRVAGAMPKDLVAPTPAIEFVGRVADADVFLRQAAIVPLISTAGSGVQLKTIEAFEAGYPVVATSRSLRGISFRPDNCVIADDPATFAAELAAMAARRLPLADGRDFHARQIAELDACMARGLAAMTRSGRAAA